MQATIHELEIVDGASRPLLRSGAVYLSAFPAELPDWIFFFRGRYQENQTIFGLKKNYTIVPLFHLPPRVYIDHVAISRKGVLAIYSCNAEDPPKLTLYCFDGDSFKLRTAIPLKLPENAYSSPFASSPFAMRIWFCKEQLLFYWVGAGKRFYRVVNDELEDFGSTIIVNMYDPSVSIVQGDKHLLLKQGDNVSDLPSHSCSGISSVPTFTSPTTFRFPCDRCKALYDYNLKEIVYNGEGLVSSEDNEVWLKRLEKSTLVAFEDLIYKFERGHFLSMSTIDGQTVIFDAHGDKIFVRELDIPRRDIRLVQKVLEEYGSCDVVVTALEIVIENLFLLERKYLSKEVVDEELTRLAMRY
jgi:hypothetical protein